MAESRNLSTEHSAYRDLVVWQKSMEFANAVIDLTGKLDTDRKHYRLVEQIEAAATSVPMNIAARNSSISYLLPADLYMKQ